MSTAEKGDPAERCPFDPEVIRARDCPYTEECPWYVAEDPDDPSRCFCAVGETPEMHLRKQLVRNLPKE